MKCCNEKLNTRLVHMRGSGYMGSCIEGQLFGVHQGYLCDAREVHKEVHRSAFKGMHKQSVELYQDHAYTAIQKCKADSCQNVPQEAARNLCFYGACSDFFLTKPILVFPRKLDAVHLCSPLLRGKCWLVLSQHSKHTVGWQPWFIRPFMLKPTFFFPQS